MLGFMYCSFNFTLMFLLILGWFYVTEGRETASYLCNIDEESEVHIIVSWWLNICCTGLDTFR